MPAFETEKKLSLSDAVSKNLGRNKDLLSEADIDYD
jgi:hypothetical protein